MVLCRRILRALSCSQYLGCPSTVNSICGCNRSCDPKSTTVRFPVASCTSYTQLQKNSTFDPPTIIARFLCWLVLRKIWGWQQKCANVGRLLQVATKVCTYVLTPCSRVLPEKLTGLGLVKKFTAFYGTRMFITAFTSARHLSLSWSTNQIHNINSLHIFTVFLLHVSVLYKSSSGRTYVHFA